MIDPLVAVSVPLAFAITATALLLARRASERDRERAGQVGVPPPDVTPETRRERYLNGGWH